MDAANLLSKRAELNPEREALLELATGRRYTYAELNRRSNQVANFLRSELAVEEGDRVSILAHNSVVYLDLLYGLMKVGAVFAPLNWRLTAHELTFIVNDCQPKVLICGPEFVPVVEAMRPKIQVPHFLTVGKAELPEAIRYEVALENADPAEPPRPPLEGNTAACILYTSGTTGYPKGAVIPQRQVLWNCINTVISWGLNEKDVTPILTPLFHSGGLFAFLTPILYAGGRVVLARGFDPGESLRVIQAEGCTVILGVPTLFQMWMNAPEFPGADFSRVRFFINGGAPLPLPLAKAWRQTKGGVLRLGYGLTEVGVNCFTMTDEDSLLKPGSVGKPIFHSQMRLVDPETGQDAPRGEPGELWIQGPHVCLGYWRNPAATAEALQEGYFHTGDMARQDEDGYYYIIGRFKDMIKSGGENVYAAEVEAVFREHPAVADAALIGLPDPKWGEVGLLVVALKPAYVSADPVQLENELLALCQGRLARFKIPKRFAFTRELPYSPYGKVMKADLKKQFS